MEQHKQQPVKPWYKKTWVIVVGVILLLAIISNLGKKDESDTSSSTSSAQSAVSEQPAAKEWVAVYTFKGNGMKKSPVFQLTGGEARLRYSYRAPGGTGTGMFSVYVVDEGKDIMETGGIPEVMTQAENEDSESALQKGSGRYYLHVNASGDWTVTVEERK